MLSFFAEPALKAAVRHRVAEHQRLDPYFPSGPTTPMRTVDVQKHGVLWTFEIEGSRITPTEARVYDPSMALSRLGSIALEELLVCAGNLVSLDEHFRNLVLSSPPSSSGASPGRASSARSAGGPG